MSRPLVNILTRTSKRPWFFSRCMASVVQQTYFPVRWYVSVDYPPDARYVRGGSIVLVPFLDGASDKLMPPNLYLNRLMDEVKDGWIMYLDDDDEFTSHSSVERAMANVESDDDFIVFRTEIRPGTEVPIKEPHDIERGDITGQCFLFHSKHRKHAQWSANRGGDFEVFCSLGKHLNVKMVNETLVRFQQGPGEGKRKDREDA